MSTTDRRHALGSPGSFTEVLTFTTSELEADYEHPVTHEDLALVLEDETEPIADEERDVDINPRGRDAFAF